MEISLLKVNGVSVERMYSDYACTNTLEYEKDPIVFPVSFEVNNKQIDFAYRPRVAFTFKHIDVESYRFILWEVNKPEFEVEYFDYTLGKQVKRTMSMTSEELEMLQVFAGNLEGIFGFTVSFVSRYGYESKEDLENNNPIMVVM